MCCCCPPRLAASRLTPLCRLLKTAVALPKSSSISCWSGSLLGVCHGRWEDPGSGASADKYISQGGLNDQVIITMVRLDAVVQVGSLVLTLYIIQVKELNLPQRSNNLSTVRVIISIISTRHRYQPLYRLDLIPFYSVLDKSMSASIP